MLAALIGCSGGMDTGTDGGGTPGPDGGSADAGEALDGGGGMDGGATDDGGGATDGGFPMVACDDAPDDVYAVDPATVAAAAPGEIVACAEDGALTMEQLESQITADGVTVASGAQRILLAYRTERQPGVPGVGSALLLIPDTPVDGPLIVVNHGTAGHADTCAPSTRDTVDPDLALPWVASGLATITVDYAGLGTPGIQGYGDAFDTAQSVLDGARAAQRYLREARPLVITGHSQGGAATLSAQGLAPTYAPELTVEHAIAFAGGTDEALELTPASAPFLGAIPITGGLGVNRAIWAMLVYADFANRFGEERAGDGFHPSIRDTVVASMETDCIFAMATTLATPSAGYVPPNTFGQLVDPDFLAGLQACVRGDAECTPEGMAFLEQRTERGFIGVDGDGADVLLISGSLDTLHPGTEFSCVRDAAEATGATVDACYVTGATHFDITGRGIGTALELVLEGTLTCPTPEGTPPPCGG